MVGSQVGLALGAVDQHGIDGLAGLQLDIGGEGSAAHAHDALLLDDLNDLIGGQLFQGLVGLHGLVQGVLAVVLDDNAQDTGALVGVGMRLHGHNGAADGAMDRSADESGLLADELANLYGVTGLDHRIGGSADVHSQGNDHRVGLGELLKGQMLGVFLILGGMDAAVEALVALCPGLGHIGLDGVYIDLGVIPKLDALGQEFLRPSLLLQALIDLLPGAVLLGVDFALAVFGTAALAVNQALGAVYNGADAAGDVQIALGAGAAGLLGQGHAMVTYIIERIGRGEDRQRFHLCHGLHAQAAGNHHHILRPLGNEAGQLLLRLHLVAEEIQLGRAGDVLALDLSEGGKFTALRLFGCVELFEALVAGHYEEVVLPREQAFQLFFAL